MSFDRFFDNDDDDDGQDPTPASTPSGSAGGAAVDVLPLLALEAAVTKTEARRLEHRVQIVIIKVPSAAWCELMQGVLRRFGNAPEIFVAAERVKKSGVYERVGLDRLKHLSAGRCSVVYVSHDPDEILDRSVLAAVDQTIVISPLTVKLLRTVIRRVTGGIARNVTEEMAALELPTILACVRQDLTARACVEKLRLAVGRREPTAFKARPLSELPLTAAVRKWSDQTLADLAAVKTGDLAPSQLVFGVLEGPPGTGKTTIGQSLAASAGWTFVPDNVGQWFVAGDGALGGVAKNLHAFIDKLIASAPSIGFLDEIDSLPNRATIGNHGRDWWTPVVNLALTELDRLNQSGKPILLLGGTNHYDKLDTGLIRSGRMQQRIPVHAPTDEGDVRLLLAFYFRNDLTEDEISKFVPLAIGATPATVEGWSKEARATARAAGRKLMLDDILEQVLPPDSRSPEDLRAIAIHEIGHAIVAHRLGVQVDRVSILQDGPYGGSTSTRPSTQVLGWQQVQDRVAILLGGRAADLELGAGPNAGAESDLEAATSILVAAIERQGLGGSLLHWPTLGLRDSELAGRLEANLVELLEPATGIVRQDREQALRLTSLLLERRILSGGELVDRRGRRTPLAG
jgi:cell division protease FtsH